MGAQASAPEEDRRWRLYLRLWAGNTVSEFGNGVSFVALPLIAVVTLGASPFQVGVLNALEFAAYLGLSLLIGVWVDRHDRRAIMIATDAGRAACVVAVVVLAATGKLNLGLLFALAAVLGLLGVMFATATPAYVQQLVGRGLTSRTTKWGNSAATASRFGGRSLAGVLVQTWSAAGTLVIDAVSFVVSAVAVASIPASAVQQAAPKPIPKGGFYKHVKEDVAEGLRFVRHSKFLWGMLRFMVHSNFLLAGVKALTVPFLLQEVGVSASAVGLLVAVSAAAGFLGSLWALGIARRIKPGIAFGLFAAVGPLFNLLLPLTTGGAGMLWFAAGTFLADFAASAFIILAVSHRYQIVPEGLMGRVAVSMRTFFFGVIPIGAVVGGALGEAIGLRPAMWAMAVGMVLLPLWMIRTPAWKLTHKQLGIMD